MIKFRDLKSSYYCTNCGFKVSASTLDYIWRSEQTLPECPSCHQGKWMHERDYKKMTHMSDEIVLSRKKLKDMLTKQYIEAAPYTGEYHTGKADLLNELLGNDPIDWAEHPNYARHHKR